RTLERARSGGAPHAARRIAGEGERPHAAPASERSARRVGSDGVLFPEQRSQRRLLSRGDQPRGLPADRDHDAKARSARMTTLNAETTERAENAFPDGKAAAANDLVNAKNEGDCTAVLGVLCVD